MMAIVQSRRGKEGRQNIRWEEGVKPGEIFLGKVPQTLQSPVEEIRSRPLYTISLHTILAYFMPEFQDVKKLVTSLTSLHE